VIEIVPATMSHARAIRLRDGDAREVAALGFTQEEGFAISLGRAVWADAYLVDGEVGAILGFSLSCLLGDRGQPWLMTGEPVNRVRKSFARLARDRISDLRRRYRYLANYVHADYTASLRFMAWLGFTVEPPQPFGRLGAPFCFIWMGKP
jgi:hypothetical protein